MVYLNDNAKTNCDRTKTHCRAHRDISRDRQPNRGYCKYWKDGSCADRKHLFNQFNDPKPCKSWVYETHSLVVGTDCKPIPRGDPVPSAKCSGQPGRDDIGNPHDLPYEEAECLEADCFISGIINLWSAVAQQKLEAQVRRDQQAVLCQRQSCGNCKYEDGRHSS